MIDTAILVWGKKTGTAARLAAPSFDRRQAELVAEPVWLDIDALALRLGNDGNVTSKRYGDHEWQGGHWSLEGGIELMYREGTVEARTSLPKHVTGRNDLLLTDVGVHAGLRSVTAKVSEAIDHPLSLREAVPTRLDYVFQEEVPSLRAALTHIERELGDRRRRTLNKDPRGGWSLVYGYGSGAGSYVVRFYDKVGELRAHGFDPGNVTHELDVPVEYVEAASLGHGWDVDHLLRYEIQDQRGDVVRLIAENGYRAGDVRERLVEKLARIGPMHSRDLAALVGERGDHKYAVPLALAAAYLADNPDAWPLVEAFMSSSSRSRWRGRARHAANATFDWQFEIPRTTFAAGAGSLWEDDDAYDQAGRMTAVDRPKPDVPILPDQAAP